MAMITKLLACFLLAFVVALWTTTTPASGQTLPVPAAAALAGVANALKPVVDQVSNLSSSSLDALASSLILLQGAVQKLLDVVDSLRGLGFELSNGFANLVKAVLKVVLALIALLLSVLTAADVSVPLVLGILTSIIALVQGVLAALGVAV